MGTPDFSLAALLGGVGRGLFFDEYWEKQPLHVSRGDHRFYAGLLSSDDIEEIIAFTRPKFVDPSAFTEEPPRAKTFVQGWLADRQIQDACRYPTIDEVRRAYERGKTVIIMTMQQRWRPVAALCRNLESVFHCPVHANMYLTPEGAQGFDAHFDTHEVFVLQLEGSKQWRLYGAPRELPLVDERFNIPRDQLGPVREVELRAGDLLYIPRGFVHEAFTAEHASLHLTVGVNVYRWADLLGEALAEMTRNDRRFRESVPSEVVSMPDKAGAMEDHFRALLAVLAEQARVQTAARRLGDEFHSHLQPLPSARGPAREGVADVDLDTLVEKTPGLVCRVVEEGGWVSLQFPGGKVGGPRRILAALTFVANNDGFAIRELPDELSGSGKLVLARRLLGERVLRVSSADANGSGSVLEMSRSE
jgi:ribosomal protein L16 Arg81 hydroxylase